MIEHDNIIFHQYDHALWGIFPPTKFFQPLNVLLPDILFFRNDRNNSIGRLTWIKLREKSSFWSFCGPYFLAFGLNTDLKNSQYEHFPSGTKLPWISNSEKWVRLLTMLAHLSYKQILKAYGEVTDLIFLMLIWVW